jgi:hypothetical protein
MWSGFRTVVHVSKCHVPCLDWQISRNAVRVRRTPCSCQRLKQGDAVPRPYARLLAAVANGRKQGQTQGRPPTQQLIDYEVTTASRETLDTLITIRLQLSLLS